MNATRWAKVSGAIKGNNEVILLRILALVTLVVCLIGIYCVFAHQWNFWLAVGFPGIILTIFIGKLLMETDLVNVEITVTCSRCGHTRKYTIKKRYPTMEVQAGLVPVSEACNKVLAAAEKEALRMFEKAHKD